MSEISSQKLIEDLKEDLLKLSNLTDLKTYNKVVGEVRNQMKKRRGIKSKRGMSYDELYEYWIDLIKTKLKSINAEYFSLYLELGSMKKTIIRKMESMNIPKTSYTPFLIVFEKNLNLAMNMIFYKDKRGINKINYRSLINNHYSRFPYFVYDVQVINCNFIDLKEKVTEIKKDQRRRFLTVSEMVSLLMYQKLIVKGNVIAFDSVHCSEKLYPVISIDYGRPILRWSRLTNTNDHNKRRQWVIPHCISEV
jgi:hypothetical protein